MQIVSNEVPSGLINGVNKVYTLSKTSLQVTDVVVDGVEYFDFTCPEGSTTLTLTDAPTLSIHVDYLASGYSTTPALNSTSLQDLRTICYNILREEEDTTAYPYVLMDVFINTAQQNILGGRVINPLTKEEARKGEVHFLNKEAFYANIPPTTLSTATTIAATTLDASTTNFATSGALYIAGNVVTYTGITATSFTGCSGVLFAHPAGTQVTQLYELPADYGSVINVIYKNKVKMEQKLYDDMFEDLNNYKGTPKNRTRSLGYYDQPYRIQPFYTIIDATYLLIFNYQDLDAMIKLRYEKIVTPMLTAASTCAIDNDLYAQTVIPYLAVGEMLFSRGEEGRAAQLIGYGISKLKEMYEWYNNTDFEKISGVHYKLGRGKLNI